MRISSSQLQTKLLAIFLVLLVLISACSKDDNGPDYKYVTFNEEVYTLASTYIAGLISTISTAYPEAVDLQALVGDDVNVHRIVYKTTMFGEEIEASGLVCVPSEQGEYPLLCFLNGTNTLNADAPSVNPSLFSYQMVEGVASMGFIVVIPDYPGFGASSTSLHPYMIAEPTIQSVTDMLRATVEFVDKGINKIEASNDLYFYGYSQGGWAALTMHKEAETNLSAEFNLVGSACGAGAYDLDYINSEFLEHETYTSPMYMAYIAHAYKSYGEYNLPLASLFKEPYATAIPGMFDGKKTAGQINALLTTNVSSLVTEDYLQNYDEAAFASVRSALVKNSVAAWKTTKPVILLHGTSDNQVFPDVTDQIYADLIAAGTSPNICTKVLYPGLDHSTALIPVSVRSLLFLNGLKDN